MLSQLYIENIAVIQKASIQLREGLNVFTGETGAGKTSTALAIMRLLPDRISAIPNCWRSSAWKRTAFSCSLWKGCAG